MSADAGAAKQWSITQLPVFGLATGFMENPAAERNDETRLLGERNEVERLESSAFGMLPSNERLVSEHAPGRKSRDRLIVQLESARARFAIDRTTKLRFELEASQCGDVHLRLERCSARFAFSFRAIQREIGVAQHVISALVWQQ